MTADSDGANRLNTFALVTYIPDPLGSFLDHLRHEIVPDCIPHAHVTLVPPRPLPVPPEAAFRQVCEAVEDLPAFELQATELNVFPVTNVVYIEIGLGRQTLMDLHERLNRDAWSFDEPFLFHPHITLAQELPPDRVEEAATLARKRWDAYPYSRIFPVDTVTFVQGLAGNRWIDLAGYTLHMPAPRR